VDNDMAAGRRHFKKSSVKNCGIECIINFYQCQTDINFMEECFIQIPTPDHLLQTKNMYAAKDEDQYERLSHMVETIKKIQKNHPSLPVITSDQAQFSNEWHALFAAINRADVISALQLFAQIPPTDVLLQSLLTVHPLEYLQKIILYSVDAQSSGTIPLGTDTLITPRAFEILLYDIATTVQNKAKLYFSFGLPTHHAYSQLASGFCVINKTAVLIRHAELTHTQSLNYVIVGTDINRDNGLCAILMNTASHLDICHVDVFDSRVYPMQDFAYIKKELDIAGTQAAQPNICCWNKNRLTYYAVDLSLRARQDSYVHPAILFAVEKINETIQSARTIGQQTFILLPTGWDSHEDETAACGKCVNGIMMGSNEAHQTRFSNEDLNYFYESILTLCKNNKDYTAGLYWGLEGGYDRGMYEKQIELFLSRLDHWNRSRPL
jgi:acetoin utilization deacetylase AcuC-like enzyme